MKEEKIYKKTWFIIVMIIFFFPVGLYLMWKFTNWNKNIKIAVCALIIIIGVFGILTADTSNTSLENNENDLTASQLNEPENDEPKLTPQEQFAKDNKLTADISNAILEASSSIGVPLDNISSFRKIDNWANGERYQYGYEGIAMTVYMNPDGTVNSINSGDFKFIDNGKVNYQVKDKIVTSTEKTYITTAAKSDVKDRLKAPKSAEFPGTILEADQWIVSKDGTTYYVQSYVDSQNSFGAMIRSQFIAQYTWSGNTDTLPTLVDIAIE